MTATTDRPEAIGDQLRWVHAMLRRDLASVRDLARSAAAGAPAVDVRSGLDALASRGPLFQLRATCLGYCQVLHSHHGGEDDVLFPAVRRAAPHLHAAVDRLEADHRAVASVLAEVEELAEDLDRSTAREALVAALTRLSATPPRPPGARGGDDRADTRHVGELAGLREPPAPPRRHSRMRTPPSLLAALAALVLAGSACGDEGSADVTARDPSPTAPSGPPDAAVPDGPVRTANLAIVMDTGSPELCLGPVAESYPPQCGGPAMVDWDWAEHPMHEQQGDVRWGTYALTGTWDGTAFTATEAIPAALYDPASPTPTPTPTPATSYDDAELERIATELQAAPGVIAAYGGEGTGGHVLVDVTYDDGTLQDWADETYGAGVVLVNAALVDAG